jgi:hypothetical protein
MKRQERKPTSMDPQAMRFHLFLTCLSGGTGEKAGPHGPNRLPAELPVPAKRPLIDDWRIDDW